MAATFDTSSGRLCLDFANTQHDRDRPDGREDLHAYADLVAFGRQTGTLAPDAARRLTSLARREPERAASAFRRALALRETTHRVFSRIAADAMPDPDDLRALRAAAAIAFAHGEYVRVDGRFDWGLEGDEPELDWVTWAVAQSASRLLTERDRPPIRECSGDGCTWLFLDNSRNRSRRWCSMRDCGNRAKARRHYQRVRAGGAS